MNLHPSAEFIVADTHAGAVGVHVGGQPAGASFGGGRRGRREAELAGERGDGLMHGPNRAKVKLGHGGHGGLADDFGAGRCRAIPCFEPLAHGLGRPAGCGANGQELAAGGEPAGGDAAGRQHERGSEKGHDQTSLGPQARRRWQSGNGSAAKAVCDRDGVG